MDKLYIETKGWFMQITEMMAKFEATIQLEDIQYIKGSINDKLGQIGKACEQLDIYVTKEPANRRYDAKLKVDQLKYDLQHYRAAFNSMQFKKDQRFLEQKRREELLSSTSLSSASSAQVQLTMDNEQGELRHISRLTRANDEIDRIIDHGENVLNGIRVQNDSLKTIKRKILNVTNALGLSNTLMRMIERRSKSDKYILYGGMVLTFIVMILVIKYLI